MLLHHSLLFTLESVKELDNLIEQEVFKKTTSSELMAQN